MLLTPLYAYDCELEQGWRYALYYSLMASSYDFTPATIDSRDVHSKSIACLVLESHIKLVYFSYGNANQTLGCVWETLALMGARHLISPRWLGEM